MNLIIRKALGIVGIIIFTSTTISLAQDLDWTPKQMVNLPVVQSTEISPDGRFVAYQVRESLMDKETSEYRTHIWVAKTDGSMQRQFTRGDQSAYSPAFTPDSKYLTFISARGDENSKPQLYKMPVDGGEAEAVTHAENGINSYKWSEDGNFVAYTMVDPPTEEEKKKQSAKEDVIILDENHKYNHIYVQAADADSAQQVSSGNRHVTSFDWSPDGDQIVFAYGPTPKTDDLFHTTNIALVPADSGEVKDLVVRDGVDSNPHFSPDGTTIAFTSQGGQAEPVGLSDLYIVSADGGTPEELAHTPDRNASILGWTSDSNGLLVYEPYKTVSGLYLVSVSGAGSPERINPEDGVYSGFSMNSTNRQLAFVYQNSETPGEVYTAKVEDFTPDQISKQFADIEFPEMGKTELISWTSDDGMEVEGLLTYPVDYEEDKSYPLILNVHGGPAGVYSQTFTGAGSIYALQYFAEEGYAILRPNPRGSTGYGKEFRYANVQDWGFGDFEDLMSGVDKVIEMGVADADSLVEMGWSYGGFMTSFIVTKTNRFKAVSMGAGLSNLFSMTGTTDIPTYLTAHMDGNYWEEGLQEVYERHSAIFNIDEVTTPTQIIHGQEDERVPISQGQEFYWALQQRNIPTEMIVYPRTPHGPRQPKFTADVSKRILDWFDKHLDR